MSADYVHIFAFAVLRQHRLLPVDKFASTAPIVTAITANIPDDAPVTSFSSEIYRYITEAAKSPVSLRENPAPLAKLEKQIAIAAQPRGDHWSLASLAGGFSLIVIEGIVMWYRRRNKQHKRQAKLVVDN